MRGLEQIPWLYDLGLWFAEKLGFMQNAVGSIAGGNIDTSDLRVFQSAAVAELI